MDDERIEAFIASQVADVQPIIRRLRVLVQATLPDMIEYLDVHNVIRYGRDTKASQWRYYISGHKGHANLGFVRGAGLPDPDGLIEGTGKNLRHVKVKTVAAAENPALRQLLEAADRLDQA